MQMIPYVEQGMPPLTHSDDEEDADSSPIPMYGPNEGGEKMLCPLCNRVFYDFEEIQAHLYEHDMD